MLRILLLLQFIAIVPMAGQDQTVHTMKEKQLETPHGNWNYATNGQGEAAILYLHGANSSQKIWKNQYALMVEEHKNIFVDLLGYGDSDQPESGYGLTNWIEGIHLILEQEQIKQVAIVAHSNGVIFAKEYYRAYPDQVVLLILLDGMLKPMIPEPVLDWMRTTLEREDYEAFMESNIERMPTMGLDEADADLLKSDARNTPKRVTKAELALVSDPATRQELVIRCPVTIIHAQNPSWDEAYREWLPDIVPDHQLIEWSDAGHFIPLQYPERLNALIRAVVSRY